MTLPYSGTYAAEPQYFYIHMVPNAVTYEFVDGGEGGTVVKTVTGRTDEPVEDKFVPQLTRDGWTLEGWYTQPNGAGDKVEGLPDAFKWDAARATTEGGVESCKYAFYSSWTADAAAFVFVANGGQPANPGRIDGATGQANSQTALPTTSREGYSFEGWFEAGNGYDVTTGEFTGSAITAVPGTFPVGTTYYYAKWSPKTSTLTFVPGAGTLSDPRLTDGSMTGDVDSAIANVNVPLPTRTGYTFNGWYEFGNGYDEATQQFSGQAIGQLPATFPTADVKYMARYTANPAKIVFTANFDGNNQADVEWAGHTDVTLASLGYTTLPVDAFSRNGYDFAGFWTADGSTPEGAIDPVWGTELTASTLPAAFAYPTATSGVTTYYAKWTPKTATIAFDSGWSADAGKVESLTGGTDTAVTGTLVEFNTDDSNTRAGWTWLGWYASEADRDAAQAQASAGDEVTVQHAQLPEKFSWPAETNGVTTFYGAWVAGQS